MTVVEGVVWRVRDIHGGRWWAMVGDGPAGWAMVGGAVGTCVHGVVLDCVGAWMSVDDLWMTVANVAGYVLSYGFIRCQCVGASGISYFLNYLNVSS